MFTGIIIGLTIGIAVAFPLALLAISLCRMAKDCDYPGIPYEINSGQPTEIKPIEWRDETVELEKDD